MTVTAKCPNCGCVEDLPDEYVGSAIVCDSCGSPFIVGEVCISRKIFFSAEPSVACPYCKEMNSLPEEAANRKVQCWNCNQKFFLSVKMPQKVSPTLNKEQMVNAFTTSKNVNRRHDEESTFWAGAKAIFWIVVLIVCVAIGLPSWLFLFREQTGVGSSLIDVFYDDDTCFVEYNRAMLLRDYETAEKWAKRMRVYERKKIALKRIEDAKKRRF